jgi:transposase InsO family protein
MSRKTFYAILSRARAEGQAAALESSGLDHGPISVHDKMTALGMDAPSLASLASLARIFREKGVARLEPKKKPRTAYRRFVYPAPNACWQLDATEYVLTGGRTCVIFQLEDDHSRVAVASHVADGETSQGALAVVKKGIAARGVLQRLLTDNGMALNPSRRGWEGQLVSYVTSLGVEAITDKPYKPTTQGKNERFHQTLFRWLDKQPLAGSIAELQEQVDRFDVIYNTERPHQGLPGRITPQVAWDATPVAEPPRPKPTLVDPVIPEPWDPPDTPAPAAREVPARVTGPGEWTRKVRSGGGVTIRDVAYQIGRPHAGEHVHVIIDADAISFYSTRTGERLIHHPLPEPGTRYVGSGKPRHTRPKTEPSPMSRDKKRHRSPEAEPSPNSRDITRPRTRRNLGDQPSARRSAMSAPVTSARSTGETSTDIPLFPPDTRIVSWSRADSSMKVRCRVV